MAMDKTERKIVLFGLILTLMLSAAGAFTLTLLRITVPEPFYYLGTGSLLAIATIWQNRNRRNGRNRPPPEEGAPRRPPAEHH
jgi:hypothetical protein